MAELQAVVLCGGSGSRMTAISDHIPKCFLPVCGVPMFWYPLNTVVKAGVKDVKLVFREQCRSEVERFLKTPLFAFEGVSLEPIFIDRENDDWGSADVIRSISQKITKDVVLISGDFISDASITPMVDQFRAYRPDLYCFVSDHCVTAAEPGPKVKKSKGRDLIGLCEKEKRLVFLASEEDFDTPVNAMAWLEKFPKVSCYATLNDCHVYILKQNNLAILQKMKKFTSLKADLIPYMLEQQNKGANDSAPVCMVYCQPAENGSVCAHANTIGAFFEVNKAIIRSIPRISPLISLGQSFDFKKSGISAPDSRVDNGAKVANGAVIKRSLIGDRCQLGEKARVQNSLLMDGVTVAKGASVSNSILCPGVVVEEGAEVVNCIVVNEQKISANSKVQNEVVEADDEDGAWAEDC